MANELEGALKTSREARVESDGSRESRDKYRRRRSHSRDRSRSYSKGHHRRRRYRSSSYSRSRSRGRRHRSREHHSRSHHSHSHRRSSRDEYPREHEHPLERVDLRKKEIEEAQRDDLTVLVINLHLSADERDIYELFTEHAGKVRDIQCVRDSRSGKSKGVAYVEFYTQEAVIKALSMSGFDLKGQRIRVQSSQAEKNRAAKAAKMLQQSAMDASDSPFTIYVGGLIGALSALTESELKQLFSPFGTIIDVTIHRDENGEPKGFAFLKFRRSSEAKEAMNTMNGFEIGGQQIKVGYAQVNNIDGKSRLSSIGDHDLERLDDEAGGLISGANNKIALMQKLQRNDQKTVPSTGAFNGSSSAKPAVTCNIILSNMFSSSDPGLDDPNFFTEIEEDVRDECSKYGEVISVYLNKTVVDGKVWVKFKSASDAGNASKSLHGRYFAGNTIKVEFVNDDTWRSNVQ